MPTFTRILADAVVVLHLAFIVFVLLGGLLALWWRWVPLIHLPSALWGAAVELFGWICPLTPLEHALRRASGDAGYSTDFVEQYLLPLVYPANLTRSVQVALGAGVIIVNVVVYGLLLHRRPRCASTG